jgi:tetratricopeptide (TPR) repeat protein
MLKKTFLLLFAAAISFGANAQSADDIYNKYLDFNLARLQGENSKVLTLGEEIIPNADKLPEKARITFYFSVGKMYEDRDQLAKARPFYEQVAAAAPDYYVVHRALGYLYLADAKEIEKKMTALPNDPALMIEYEKIIRKVLPQLEKAQACDPSDDTLALIKLLYRNIKDNSGAKSLNQRLKALGNNCIDILDDH